MISTYIDKGEIMRKNNLVLFYGCFCSLIFALFYYLMFTMLYQEVLHIDYLQIGIYEKATSLQNCQNKLNELDIQNYTYQSDEKTVVICGFELYQETLDLLKKADINYVKKELEIKDDELKTLWEQKLYQEVLERMYSSESKRNDHG